MDKVQVYFVFLSVGSVVLTATLLFAGFDRSGYFICLSIILIGCAVCRTVARWWQTLLFRHRGFASRILSRWAKQSTLSQAAYRTTFRDTVLPVKKPFKDKPHYISAANRDVATDFAVRLGRMLGHRPFFVQRSASDERKSRAGSRTYYWGKDTTCSYSELAPENRDLLTLIDVDYYLDMSEFLSNNWLPVLLYTVVPHCVAEAATSTCDFSFTFDRVGDAAVMQYVTVGGGKYSHELWDWGHDTLIVKRYLFGCICVLTQLYNVERKMVDKHRELIFLMPVKAWRWPFSIVAAGLDAATLTRLNPIVNVDGRDFLRLNVIDQRSSTHLISTGLPGEFTSSTIPAGIDEALRTVARAGKNQLTLYQARSAVEPCAPNGDLRLSWTFQSATRGLEFYRTLSGGKVPYVFPSANSTLRYRFDVDCPDFDAKQKMVAFMSPIIDAAFVPDICPANEIASFSGRLAERQAASRNLPKSTGFYDECVNEFITLVVAGTSLSPMDYEDVYDKMSTPSQRALVERDQFVIMEEGSLRPFQKAEAYQKPSDPRIICPFATDTKVEYSRYIYSAAEHLKHFHWYGFSKQPADVAARIASICTVAQFMALADMERLDGTIGERLRAFEQMFMLSLFEVTWHSQLLEQMRRAKNNRLKGKFVDVEQGNARGSGSPETSLFNTLVTAFAHFFAYRLMGLSAEVAFETLGVFAGDDSATPDLDPSCLQKACGMVGLTVKVEVIQRHEPGVNFLSRFFGPYVWSGDPTSCCDIVRMLSKLHVTIAMPPDVTPVMKLVEKMRSLYLTDAHTPVVGQLSTLVMRFIGEDDGVSDEHGINVHFNPRLRNARSYLQTEDISVQYPNDADWIGPYTRDRLSNLSFDFDAFDSWFDRRVEAYFRGADGFLESLLSPPLCVGYQPKPQKKDVLVRDELVPGTEGSRIRGRDKSSFGLVDNELDVTIKGSQPSSAPVLEPVPKFGPYRIIFAFPGSGKTTLVSKSDYSEVENKMKHIPKEKGNASVLHKRVSDQILTELKTSRVVFCNLLLNAEFMAEFDRKTVLVVVPRDLKARVERIRAREGNSPISNSQAKYCKKINGDWIKSTASNRFRICRYEGFLSDFKMSDL